jgi:hypothetical protein
MATVLRNGKLNYQTLEALRKLDEAITEEKAKKKELGIENEVDEDWVPF